MHDSSGGDAVETRQLGYFEDDLNAALAYDQRKKHPGMRVNFDE